MRELPEGWEILVACYLLGGEIRGKVRLQKVVSEMQRIGLPVPHYFIIHKMGAYSTALEDCASKMEKEGYITIRENPLGYEYKNRVDYVLTQKGGELLKNIIPKLKEDFYFLIEELREIKLSCNNNRMPTEIVNEIHEKLILDSKEEFNEELSKLITEYGKLNEFFSKEDHGYCMVWIAMSGLVDLTLRSLKNISARKLPEFEPEDAGRYFIVSKAKEGLELISLNYPLEECSTKCECISKDFENCKELEMKIRAVFEAINSNSEFYGYKRTEDAKITREGSLSPEFLEQGIEL